MEDSSHNDFGDQLFTFERQIIQQLEQQAIKQKQATTTKQQKNSPAPNNDPRQRKKSAPELKGQSSNNFRSDERLLSAITDVSHESSVENTSFEAGQDKRRDKSTLGGEPTISITREKLISGSHSSRDNSKTYSYPTSVPKQDADTSLSKYGQFGGRDVPVQQQKHSNSSQKIPRPNSSEKPPSTAESKVYYQNYQVHRIPAQKKKEMEFSRDSEQASFQSMNVSQFSSSERTKQSKYLNHENKRSGPTRNNSNERSMENSASRQKIDKTKPKNSYSAQRIPLSTPVTPKKSASRYSNSHIEDSHDSARYAPDSNSSRRRYSNSLDIENLLKKITPGEFEKMFYEKSVKDFQNRKSAKIESLKQQSEMNRSKELTFKPSLNDSRNKNIKSQLLDRMTKYEHKKQAEIEALQKQMKKKKELEETCELTFQPMMLTARQTEKYLSVPKKQPLIHGKAARNDLLHNKSTATKENNLPQRKQSLSNATEKLSKKAFEKTSPDILERFKIYQQNYEETIKKLEKQLTAQPRPSSKSSAKDKKTTRDNKAETASSYAKKAQAKKESQNLKQKESVKVSQIFNSKSRVSSAVNRSSHASRNSVANSPTDRSKSKKTASTRQNSPRRPYSGSEYNNNSKRYSVSDEQLVQYLEELRNKHLTSKRTVSGKKEEPLQSNLKEDVQKVHQNIKKIQSGLEKLQEQFRTEFLKVGMEGASQIEQSALSSVSRYESQDRSRNQSRRTSQRSSPNKPSSLSSSPRSDRNPSTNVSARQLKPKDTNVSSELRESQSSQSDVRFFTPKKQELPKDALKLKIPAFSMNNTPTKIKSLANFKPNHIFL